MARKPKQPPEPTVAKKREETAEDLCVDLFMSHAKRLLALSKSKDCSTQDLKMINEFLKNNNITCSPRSAPMPEELGDSPFSEEDLENHLRLVQ